MNPENATVNPAGTSGLIQRIENLSPAKRKLLEKRLRENRPDAPRYQTIRPRKDRGAVPLSFAQQRLWFLDRFEPVTPFYNVFRAFTIKGNLDVGALERGLDEIVRRHEALRTTFSMRHENPVQVVAPHRSLSLPVTDLRSIPEQERYAHARGIVEQECSRPFELSIGPLFRVRLLRLDVEEHVLSLTMHHIVTDGWSMEVFFRELAMLYDAFSAGRPTPLPEPPVQYADFALWQRQWLEGDVLERQRSYWKRKLSGLPVLDLPTDRPRPPIQTYNGATRSLRLPMELSDFLKALSRKENGTLFMTLLAAFKVLLSRYTGKDDILVGTPIANRIRLEIEGLIGFFVNTLIIRTDLSGPPSFRELLGQVRQNALEAYSHQDLPFEKLVEDLQSERDLSRTPLFQVMFQLRNVPKMKLHFPGLSVLDFPLPNRTAKFDLSLDIAEEGDGLCCEFEYNTDLFDEDTIRRMTGNYRTLLGGIRENPDQRISALPLLTDAERNQLLLEWNETRSDFPRNICAHQLFESQVERSPDATAVICEGKDMTFQELNARANTLAAWLKKEGVRGNDFVGICMERSLEMVVGILGVLKSGGAYVPLDSTSPKERLSLILGEVRPTVLLTQERLLPILPDIRGKVVCLDRDWEEYAAEGTDRIFNSAASGDLAYVIYTSGSTGKPKGVMITHEALCNNITWATKRFGLSESDVHLQLSSLCFDASVSELFLPLATGGRIVLPPPGKQYDTKHLIRLIREQGITTLQIVPSLLKVLLEEEGFAKCLSLKRVVCGGEVMPFDLKEHFLGLFPADLHNTYGPTETTIDAVCWTCTKGGESRNRVVPIGRPIFNFRAYVLDRTLRPVPIGVPGELWIGGVGLARGYLNRPELTRENFIDDPFCGERGARIYKTGDLVRYRSDGNMEFLGRVDHQVKIRGYRIEPGEIEEVLRQHPDVLDVVVLAKGEEERGKRLVAYILAKRRFLSPRESEIRDFLGTRLPDYMTPAHILFLDAFPVTPSGKLDRRAFPDPGAESLERERSFVAPRDELENHLKEIWQWVLDVRPIGVKDNFFALGGHSLLAVQLFSHIEKLFGKSLPLSTLFQAPTIEELAGAIRQEGMFFQWSHLVPVQPNGSRPPFFCVHPHDGDAFRFRELATMLGQDQPFYGLKANGGKSDQGDRAIQEIAADYIEEMRQVQPVGPYFLGGHCLGGIIAHEMARQLIVRGEEVPLVALIFAYAPGHPRERSNGNFLRNAYYDAYTKVDRFLTMFPLVAPSERISYLQELIEWNIAKIKKNVTKYLYRLHSSYGRNYMKKQEEYLDNINKMASIVTPGNYPGRLTLFRTQKEPLRNSRSEAWGWDEFTTGGIEIHEVPGYPQNHQFRPRMRILAEKLSACLANAQRKSGLAV